ncbi:hypothetical protein M3J09_009085 [Ascochyta lentis]
MPVEDMIPHEVPKDSPASSPQLYYPKQGGLTWEDFHPAPLDEKESLPLHKEDSRPGTNWKQIANSIYAHRTRFALHNKPIGNPRCCNLDRSTVLAVYQEALAILEHTSDLDAEKIYREVRRKVDVILDIRTAQPNDSIFLIEDTFLKPLEPQYAYPRLNYYNRGDGQEDDRSFGGGWPRLKAWRKEGWPHVYPKQAVEQEKKMRAELKRKGRRRLRPTRSEEVLIGYHIDAAEWGDEVDADSERPWK